MAASASPDDRRTSVLVVDNALATGRMRLERWLPVVVMMLVGAAIASSPLLWAVWHGRPPIGIVLVGLAGIAIVVASIWVFRAIARRSRRRVTVDFDARVVQFENFRLERSWRWPTRPLPNLAFGFDDILWVRVFSDPDGLDWLLISTPRGRLTMRGDAANFRELVDAICAIAKGKPSFHQRRLFEVMLTFGGGAIVFGLFLLGLRLGWWDRVLDWMKW